MFVLRRKTLLERRLDFLADWRNRPDLRDALDAKAEAVKAAARELAAAGGAAVAEEVLAALASSYGRMVRPAHRPRGQDPARKAVLRWAITCFDRQASDDGMSAPEGPRLACNKQIASHLMNEHPKLFTGTHGAVVRAVQQERKNLFQDFCARSPAELCAQPDLHHSLRLLNPPHRAKREKK